MIPNEEKEGWYYLAVKNYLHYNENKTLSCFHSFRTKIKLKSLKKVCVNKDF